MSTAVLGSSTDLSEDLDLDKDSGDEHKHLVKKVALFAGGTVEALCGKKWVPSKSPDDLPACPTCEDMMELLKAMHGDG